VWLVEGLRVPFKKKMDYVVKGRIEEDVDV
jgi:hypothetical protein